MESKNFGEPEKLFISQDTMHGYKNATEEMLSAFGNLARVFQERDDEQLSELIDHDQARTMFFLIQQIYEIDIVEKHDLKNITELLEKIIFIVETIGAIQPRNIREDVDNLRSIASALMLAEGSIYDLRQRLSLMGTEEALQAAQYANRLNEELLYRRTIIGRRIDHVGGYLGR